MTVKKNSIAMANLTVAFKSETLLSIICKSQSHDWPTGETHLVEANLLGGKYQSLDRVVSIEMQRALSQLKMSNEENPAVLFNKICRIENQYTT